MDEHVHVSVAMQMNRSHMCTNIHMFVLVMRMNHCPPWFVSEQLLWERVSRVMKWVTRRMVGRVCNRYMGFTYSCSHLTSTLAWTFASFCHYVYEPLSHVYEHSHVHACVRMNHCPLWLVSKQLILEQVSQVMRWVTMCVVERVCNRYTGFTCSCSHLASSRTWTFACFCHYAYESFLHVYEHSHVHACGANESLSPLTHVQKITMGASVKNDKVHDRASM